jgi:hypothetical protein
MVNARKTTLAAGVACLAVLASLLVGVGPALAYGDVTVKWARVDTETCAIVAGEGGLAVDNQQPGGCFMADSADDTFFRRDDGGRALKMELWVGGRMVSKVEFHPYGEVLWVYDTASDGDTVFVNACRVSGRACVSIADEVKAVNNPPEVRNLDVAEDTQVNIDVYDDRNSDLIRSQSGRA